MDIEKMLVWMMLWISGILGQRDMRGKLFDFRERSNSSYVQIFPDRKGPFTEGSVCMRFRSDLTRQYTLFSLATRDSPDAFFLYCDPLPSSDDLMLCFQNTLQYYELQKKTFTEWTILCVSWRPSGSVLFINGRKYKKDKTRRREISADPIIIIGQMQQSFGGKFRVLQSFAGEMTDVNMWDKALTDEDMMDYFADEEMSGNIINWKALNYTIVGNVRTGPYSDPYPCVAV